MRLPAFALLAFAAAMPLAAFAAPATTKAEAAADQRYVWDLAPLFPSIEAWQAERKAIAAELSGLKSLQGTLGKDPASLRQALEKISALQKRYYRMSVYASLKADEDTRQSEAQERRQQAQALGGDLSAATAFVAPELIRLGEARINEFLAADPQLAKFAFLLKNTIRNAPHTLSDEGERVLAQSETPLGGARNIYTTLANADLPWPKLKLSDGREVVLDSQGYTGARGGPNRADRKRVFDAFFGAWNGYRKSFGQTYAASVEADVFRAKARNYPSAVAAALAGDNIPEQVYRSLVDTANEGLPTLHRALKLRARMLGLKDLAYYDIYPPLVKSDRKFSVEQSRELTLDAIKPLGEDYQKAFSQASSERWIHAYPQPGKRPGAYVDGSAYDVHPYMLLNHNNNYEGLTTYAHEWGHAMHSVLANKAQPFDTANYATFTAEIASTAHEFLLSDKLVAEAKTKDEKLFYLGQSLELLRQTFFRQTMFAEFELRTHEAVEKGEALSGDKLSQIYLDLLKRYHGDKQGVMKIDDAYGAEWAYIPHFYNQFYVFQYATSLSAAAWFVEQVKTTPAGRDTYLSVLKAGGSDYPYEILKKAGLDMATPAPYQALIRRMNSVMDEIEKLLG